LGFKKLKKNQKYMFVLGVGIFFSLLLTCTSLSQITPVNVSEENTLNLAVPPPSDLTDGGASYSDFNLTTVEPGVSSFGVWCNVTNLGTDSTYGSFNVSFYASLDTDINKSTDYFIGDTIVPTLVADASAIAKWSGIFPGSIPDGTYYVGWIIDVEDDVYEVNENNNIFYETSKTLIVETSSENSGNGTPPPPPPDPIPFVVGGLTAAAVIIPAGIYFVSKRRV
jgi:hypothetical protein